MGALLIEVRFNKKMPDQTRKDVFLKQAKREKPRGKVKVRAGSMVPNIKPQKMCSSDGSESMKYIVSSQGK